MDKFFVRELTNEDEPALKKTYIKAAQYLFPEYSQRIRDFLVSEKYMSIEVNVPMKIGAFNENKMLGLLLADKHFGGVLYIFWLMVLKEHQGKGIGTSLLAKAEELGISSGKHTIHLQADKRNVDFYQRRGFEIIGLDKKGYFGTDNYILKKLIQEPQEENFFK